MKNFLLLPLLFPLFLHAQQWIRVNQLGYLPTSIKVAVLVSKETECNIASFSICDALTEKEVFRSKSIKRYGPYAAFKSSARLNFSAFKTPGAYYIQVGENRSPNFRIAADVYAGTADHLLKYMRQQQCGYNPFLKDSCHTRDGFIIYHPQLQMQHINAVGGWHDATDYLQYVTTSTNAVYQMLFAYEQNPGAFRDQFDKNGNPGANGIPDILDEAKWGLDWLMKMNPASEMMFNQIADDRDHRGFRLPNKDTVTYGGVGIERPVYFCDGKPQGLFQFKNKTTGIASTAGKFSSAFGLAAEVLKNIYPDLSEMYFHKAKEAYKFGKANPGVAQTAPCRGPYYYMEDNWVDDMELAATQLYRLTKEKHYLIEAAEFGKQEPTTPWMGADTAHHYQWYPFVNLGHYQLATSKDKKISQETVAYLKSGLQKVYDRGNHNPFLFGVPFIWCSNNLVSAIVTQARLYYSITKDPMFNEMEASLRDWLFGCNIWGTGMIVGLPANGVSPKDPHSSLSAIYGYKLDGGLVDGPVYGGIFKGLIGLSLFHPDQFADVQSDLVVYHDDRGDYSTNEPTMDGTASLSYYLSALEVEGSKTSTVNPRKEFLGGIVRMDTTQKNIYLTFTAHDMAEGASIVRKTLKKHNVKGSFFFTGDFYRDPRFKNDIASLKKDGHYLGAHSDKHLLYAPWEQRDSLLVSKKQFLDDIRSNYRTMSEQWGIKRESARFFMPPYEWYNQTISDWCKEIGLILVNPTPGTRTGADYTYPEMGKGYLSSDSIYALVLDVADATPSGLNGNIMLIHIGTDPRRPDKFYNRLDQLITDLKKRGYSFKRF